MSQKIGDIRTLRGVLTTHRTGVAIGIVLVACVLALPFFAGDYVLTAAVVSLHLVYFSQTWNIAAGYAGLFSLGHAAFVGLGAYTSTLLFVRAGISPWFGALGGFVVAALFGAALGAIAFRYRIKGVFFAVLTLAAADICRGLAENWDWIEGPVGIFITMAQDPANMLFTSRAPYLYILLAMVLAMLWITWRLEHSRFGQSLLAIKEDEDAAEASGVDTYRCKILASALSGGLTALGGSFYAQFMLWISPDTVFSFEFTLNMMLGTMIGGAGTVLGPVFGSVLFSGISEIFRNLPFEETRYVNSAAKMIYAVILMGIMLYLPGGLMSLMTRRSRLAAQVVSRSSG
jgi:branched-chain amino acid transport system permease protein